ncbi:hypothetical protein [Acinetobacter nosocomialis]|uniref:hypothetical protein n=1 Tax=Acinetobacter nosocomialis TaxID=106654 RepID=UPI002F3F20C4
MASLLSAVQTRFFDKSNKPLAGGKVYTYEANSTNPKVTWSDEALTVQNTNPVLLDNEGTALIFFSGKYRFRIEDKYGTLVEDNPSVTSLVGIDGVTADIVKDGNENQAQINKKTVQKVDSIDDLNDLDKWESRSVYVSDVGMFEVNNDSWVFKPTSAQYVVDNTGVTQQAINNQFVMPEMYGAKANDPDFDNTAALNLTFASGKTVYSTPDKTYYVTGSLRTKGQDLIGGWKIHSKKATSRKGTWEKEVKVNNDGLDTSNNIRMMYVSSAWDLSEFLAIKALGYNMIHHYVGMAQMGWDRDGNVFDVLNNAKSAGLKVSLGIEQDPAAVSDLTAWVKSVDSYPALWAYSVVDEPVSRGLSISQQDAKIATMRSLTKKPLFTVDWQNNAFDQQYSKNYDFVFVNAYSMKNSETTIDDKVKSDLRNFRLSYGVIKSQVNVRVIPCVSMFTFNPSANFFSDNADQIVAASEAFAKVSNGDYAAFIWDGEADNQITGSVRDTPVFQDLSFRISKQPRLNLQTDAIKFGGFSNIQTDFGVSEIIHHVLQKDNDSSDVFIGASAYPIVLRSGSSSADRIEPSLPSGRTISGIAFKHNVGRLVTDLAARKNLRLRLEAFSPINLISGEFSVYTTVDGGYTSTLRFNDGVAGNKVLDYNIDLDKSYGNLIFELSDSNNYQFYRNFLRGVIILTDW